MSFRLLAPRRLAAALALAAAASLPVHAEVVIGWDFENAVEPAAGTTWTGIAASLGVGSASGVHASSSTVWSTPVGNGSSNSISSNNWSVGDYYEFSFSTLGYADLSVSFDQAGSSTGPRDFTLAYSTDGISFADYTSYSIPTGSFSSTAVNPAFTVTVDLGAVAALDNAASVMVRLVNSSTRSINGGTVASGGTGRVDNFIVNLSPVPEPGTTALLLAGLAAVGFVAGRRRA